MDEDDLYKERQLVREAMSSPPTNEPRLFTARSRGPVHDTQRNEVPDPDARDPDSMAQWWLKAPRHPITDQPMIRF